MKTGLKQLLCLFLALCVLSTVTVPAFGTQPEAVASETSRWIPGEDLPSSEELYAAYVEELFYGQNLTTYSRLAREHLNPLGQKLYDFLKEQILQVASGAKTSAVFSMDQSTLRSWGAQIKFQTNDTDAAFEEFLEQFKTQDVLTALLHDCPYELYWFDKEWGIYQTGSLSVGAASCSVVSLQFGFFVAGDWQPGNYDYNMPSVDPTDIGRVNTAVANARKTVQTHADKGDYEKLCAYKKAICDLVSYDYSAANGGNFSMDASPWQMIDVFDGDPATKVVCEGYSKAFQYLCDMTEFRGAVDCYSVSGAFRSNGSYGLHMWNIVSIGGERYLADITNSDSGTVGSDGSLFLVGGSGSVSGGYKVAGNTYTYDSDNIALWGSGEDSILCLSPRDFDPNSQIPESHNYTDIITPPTCTEQGFTTHTCTKCGDAVVDTYVDALDHTGGTATCRQKAICDRCGSEYGERNADNHTYTSQVTPPTCVDQGYTTYVCTDCGYTYQNDPVAATGVHSYLDNQDNSCEVCGFLRDAADEVKTFSVSGDLSMRASSQEEIAEKSAAVFTPTTVFDQQPSITAPYDTGKLSDSMLSSGLAMLNYIRFATRLPQVQMDDELNDKAQHGAVLLAAIDKLTHYPGKPADMDDAFYNIGAASTSTSNISWNWGYPATMSILVGLEGCLYDEDSSNIDSLGHRRWLLNPTLLNVGFGYARAENNGNYSTTQVFDTSGGYVDYDFISFPASGNFPADLFDKNVPWSVTLNPQRFQRPDLNQITVTVTNRSDGNAWTLNSTTGAPTANGQAYLGVDYQYYGIPNCIIFSPGANNLDNCSGTFTVEITGLKTKDGKDARLLYDVNFFELEDVAPPHTCEYTKTVTDPTCTQEGYTTYTCQCGDSYQTDFVDALGHTGGTATCRQKAICDRCGDEYGEVNSDNHTYISQVTPPTCLEQGYTTYTCACGDSYADTYVDPIGHSMGQWSVVTAPTCTEKGSERRDCTNCDDFETREVAVTGHNHQEEITPPTCEKKGYTTHTCKCGDSYVDTYVDATGHSMGAWTVVTAPTETEKGEERRDCANCDYFETREVDVLASAPGDLNGDDSVNDDDVILLLWHTLLPDLYPISAEADFNADGNINDEDVIYLLWHTLLPDLYPL